MKSNNNEKVQTQKLSDFSIDHILNHAGSRKIQTSDTLEQKFNFMQRFENNTFSHNGPVFDWLYYTRYHPPRLPRTGSNPLKQPVKRTPGRLPRVPFTPEQLKALESSYKKSMYLSSEEANMLAKQLDLSSIRVKIWFQNRRARDRRENRSDTQSPGQIENLNRSWNKVRD
uniref:CSON008209 protein n=1 Tax=Culicoides sonorensis TaxID=179676 RepID=A0A336M2H2_CULSO